jgi:hypothetical protein
VATAARQFIAASSAPGSQNPSLRPLLAVLARLLTQHLQGQPSWTRWEWIDGILLESAVCASDADCEIWGLAILAEETKGESVEPFTATLRLSPEGTLSEYQLRFGDSRRSLGAVPYGARSRHLVRDNPPDWLFTFGWTAA